MKSIEEFVEASLDYNSAKSSFMKELIDTLELNPRNIKSVEMKGSTDGTAFSHTIIIELIGSNEFKSENLGKVDGLTIKTPNTLEIKYGEIKL